MVLGPLAAGGLPWSGELSSAPLLLLLLRTRCGASGALLLLPRARCKGPTPVTAPLLLRGGVNSAGAALLLLALLLPRGGVSSTCTVLLLLLWCLLVLGLTQMAPLPLLLARVAYGGLLRGPRLAMCTPLLLLGPAARAALRGLLS